MRTLNELNVKLFADGADKKGMLEMYKNPLIKGFTTNPSLLRKAGVTDYRAFALDILSSIKDLPVSFEIFSDDVDEMFLQAIEIASWGENVYVKIPVMNTQGIYTTELIQNLAARGIKQNVTAVMTYDQVETIVSVLNQAPASYISVFAGRIADTGVDPCSLMRDASELMKPHAHLSLLWASTREVINIFQANEVGAQIITVPNDILNKLSGVGKDPHELSLDTVKQFYRDAIDAGFTLDIAD